MRLLRAYTEQPLAVGHEIDLEPNTAHHLLTVLRLTVGDDIVLFNGQGGEYEATLNFAKKGKAKAKVHTFKEVNRESPVKLHLYQGISRGDRMDFSLQKATELGVSSITPILCERAQFKNNEQQIQKKTLHWQQVIVSATQQSWRCQLPTLNPITSLNSALIEASAQHQLNLFLHTSTEKALQRDLSGKTSIGVFIGPEGGFSDQEHHMALNHARIIQLGPRILRTETATIAALSLVQFLAGDF